MGRNNFPTVIILRIAAMIFIAIAIIVWVYGSGNHRGIDALLVTIAAITFLILSFFVSQNVKKRM